MTFFVEVGRHGIKHIYYSFLYIIHNIFLFGTLIIAFQGSLETSIQLPSLFSANLNTTSPSSNVPRIKQNHTIFSPSLAFLYLETQFMLLLFNLQSPIFLTYPHVAGFTTFRCHNENHFSLKWSLSICGSCQAEGKTYICRLKKGNSKEPGTEFIARPQGPNGGILCVGSICPPMRPKWGIFPC